MTSFYQIIHNALALPAEERRSDISRLHQRVLDKYLKRLSAINDAEAQKPSSDGRSLKLVVGHIAAWERWIIQASLEMFGQTRNPAIMKLEGYVGLDGNVHNYKSIDEFNSEQALLQIDKPWGEIRDLAAHTATALYPLYTRPDILPTQRLEETDDHHWHCPGGESVKIPIGWFLWINFLEHEAVEHAIDLGMPKEDEW